MTAYTTETNQNTAPRQTLSLLARLLRHLLLAACRLASLFSSLVVITRAYHTYPLSSAPPPPPNHTIHSALACPPLRPSVTNPQDPLPPCWPHPTLFALLPYLPLGATAVDSLFFSPKHHFVYFQVTRRK